MESGTRPLPRWAEVGSVVVAAVAIVLAVVLRLAPEGEPSTIVRFVFQCVGLAGMITGCVLFCVATVRGTVFPTTPAGMRRLSRRNRQLVGRAAIARAVAPSGTEDLVRMTARRIVVLAPRQVMVFVGAVVLEASVVSQTTEWGPPRDGSSPLGSCSSWWHWGAPSG